MLELQSISKTFHPGTIHAKKALQNLSLSLNDGDFVTIIGGNGAAVRLVNGETIIKQLPCRCSCAVSFVPLL